MITNAIHNEIMELRRTGDFKRAVALLEPLILVEEHDYNRQSAWDFLSTFALREGRFDEALAYCQKISESDPNDAYIHHRMSIIYRLKGDYAQSERESRLLLELADDEKDLDDPISSGRFTLNTELGTMFLATDQLDECLEVCTADWTPTDIARSQFGDQGKREKVVDRMLVLARLYNKRGAYPDSVECYRRAIRICRSHRDLMLGTQELLEELGSVILHV